ncbi:MAG: hypothetical protein WDM89_15210 [Rhizomicrobium sp.]
MRRYGEASSIGDILRAALGLTTVSDAELMTSIARAFAERGEELVIVFDGLNEFGDAKAIDRFCLSLFEVATALPQEMHSMPSVGTARCASSSLAGKRPILEPAHDCKSIHRSAPSICKAPDWGICPGHIWKSHP